MDDKLPSLNHWKKTLEAKLTSTSKSNSCTHLPTPKDDNLPSVEAKLTTPHKEMEGSPTLETPITPKNVTVVHVPLKSGTYTIFKETETSRKCYFKGRTLISSGLHINLPNTQNISELKLSTGSSTPEKEISKKCYYESKTLTVIPLQTIPINSQPPIIPPKVIQTANKSSQNFQTQEQINEKKLLKIFNQIMCRKLPYGWTMRYFKKELQFFKLECDNVVMSLKIDNAFKLNFKLLGSELKESHPLHINLASKKTSTLEDILDLLDIINQWKLCLGNREKALNDIYLQSPFRTDTKQIWQTASLHGKDCPFLLAMARAVRCEDCNTLRRRLKNIVYNKEKANVKKEHEINRNIRFLSVKELQDLVISKQRLLLTYRRKLARWKRQHMKKTGSNVCDFASDDSASVDDDTVPAVIEEDQRDLDNGTGQHMNESGNNVCNVPPGVSASVNHDSVPVVVQEVSLCGFSADDLFSTL